MQAINLTVAYLDPLLVALSCATSNFAVVFDSATIDDRVVTGIILTSLRTCLQCGIAREEVMPTEGLRRSACAATPTNC